jgi:hypothetical protein
MESEGPGSLLPGPSLSPVPRGRPPLPARMQGGCFILLSKCQKYFPLPPVGSGVGAQGAHGGVQRDGSYGVGEEGDNPPECERFSIIDVENGGMKREKSAIVPGFDILAVSNPLVMLVFYAARIWPSLCNAPRYEFLSRIPAPPLKRILFTDRLPVGNVPTVERPDHPAQPETGDGTLRTGTRRRDPSWSPLRTGRERGLSGRRAMR